MIKLPEPFIQYEGCKPMFTEAQLKQAVRDALEEAAKVCDDMKRQINVNGQNGRYKECAAAIRALIKEVV